jgi:predicted nuclease with TOPRIM domain
LNNDKETENKQGTNISTDKDSTISKLTEQFNELESECDIIRDKNKDITIENNNLNDHFNELLYGNDKLKKEFGREITTLNHTINGCDMNLVA